VKPVNQASTLLLVVPVLPATGRPIAARKPVPPGPTTPRRMPTAVAATWGSTAWRQEGRPSNRTRPVGPVMPAMIEGRQWTPPLARVA
jgi:hypothetical protein